MVLRRTRPDPTVTVTTIAASAAITTTTIIAINQTTTAIDIVNITVIETPVAAVIFAASIVASAVGTFPTERQRGGGD